MYKLIKVYRKFIYLYIIYYMYLEENEYIVICIYEYVNFWVFRRYCIVVYVLIMIVLANVKTQGYIFNGENVLFRMFVCLLFSCFVIKIYLSRGIY